ncbi:MAG: hypothetical protein ACTS6O_06145 [Giesbergeria sp.]
MRENLYAYVMSNLDARAVPLSRVSRQTGIPYESLKKIAHRRTPNPGVKHVQSLADFFDSLAKPPPELADCDQKQPAALTHQAQAATNSVAQGAIHA